MNFPGIWNILIQKTVDNYNHVASTGSNLALFGVLITIAIYIIIAFLVMNKKIIFDGKKIIEFGLLSVMIATFFLPHMHDRYLYIADILSIVYYMLNKDKIYVPIGISMISLYTYSAYLFYSTSISIQFVSYLYLLLLILVSRDIYNKYLKVSD